MFGLIADLIASVTTILLPAYLSYKSLRSGDPATTTPWLIYFIMLSLALLFESWTVFIIGWLPFYSWIRLFFLLYLVLPQTQGAKVLYLSYVEPYIISHETRIDRFIGETHEKLQSMGLGYLTVVIDYIREKILGQASPQAHAPPPPAQGYASYAQDLLSRFAMPQARKSAVESSGLSAFLGNVAGAAMSSGQSASYGFGTRSVSGTEGGTAGGMPDISTIQSYLNHPSTSTSDKSVYIQSQRDRLGSLLKALDKEQQTLDLAYGTGPGRPSSSGFGLGGGLGPKSKSEQSFERVEYDEVHTPTTSSSQHSTPPQVQRTTSGGWASGWLGGSSADKKRNDDGDTNEMINKGWSAARDMTEAILSSAREGSDKGSEYRRR